MVAISSLISRNRRRTSVKGSSVLFNTLPKSGSVFIAESLAKGLGYSLTTLTNGYFPHDYLDARRLAAFPEGNLVAQEHLDASDLNLRLLEEFLPSFVVHVRDPRQATLSWTHHLIRLERQQQRLLLSTVWPALPGGYFELPMTGQIDWQIEHHFKACIKWIDDWCRAVDAQNAMRILVTTYEQFVADQQAFFNRILQFFGIDSASFRLVALDRTEAVNYRRGSKDEWREVFTPDQVRRTWDLIPEHLQRRFQWAR